MHNLTACLWKGLLPVNLARCCSRVPAAGDRDRARVLLAEALSLYESIGMPGFAQRTSARLAATSGGDVPRG
jgi:hypothetical protein